ncbi:MAG TPA: class I adenylate-forming enzyme family protein [Candidatus Polarisedimenticolia bacterium]|nr:class I adenylate-forming enzyme family protein [Candidatus Polarisedimenticolia bacterium]
MDSVERQTRQWTGAELSLFEPAGQNPMLEGPPLAAPAVLSQLLRAGISVKPEDEALISGQERWSWAELDRAAGNLASNFLSLGLKPGDRVASLMPNRPALIVLYVACLRAGMVSVPLNYRYTVPDIEHALELSGASLLVAHDERLAELDASRVVHHLPHGIVIHEGKPSRRQKLTKLMMRRGAARSLPPVNPADPAFIFFTSGSTGPAKGVTHSQESLGWMFASMAAAFEFGPDDIVLPGSSISHIGGFLYSLAALAAGARVVVARSHEEKGMLSLLREEKPTALFMLPATLFALVRGKAAKRADFASLRVCSSGGDKVPAELQREFADLAGMPIDEVYGMTEIGIVTVSPPSGQIKQGSIGRAMHGVGLSIRDESGGTLPAGVAGRLWVRTRATMLGYWRDPIATSATIKEGWVDTGDLMEAGQDGYLQFRGRRKQIIVHDGSNISPQEVEEALLQHPAIEAAGVVGVPDLMHGETVLAFVTLKAQSLRPESGELIRFARERIGYRAPAELVILAEMPLNPTGKIDRVALKGLSQNRFGRPPANYA